MKPMLVAAALAALAAASPAAAQPADRPDLIVAISVDQLSSDLFREYRPHFTGGLKRLSDGIAFANGYQAHASTETCPGHSTILTGAHPTRSGIVANDWYDRAAAREDKEIYCAEDETVPGSSSDNYTVSNTHLRVPALGDYMKQVDPQARVVSVAGKDRSAVMMGGKAPDQLWYWGETSFLSSLKTVAPPIVGQVNASIAHAIGQSRAALTPPAYCAGTDRAIQIGSRTVGTHRFQRAAGDADAFRTSPEMDAATLTLAAALVRQMPLGKGGHTDLLAIGLSATDRVGHTYGPGGLEMCLQLASLDADLASFFSLLDRSGLDYSVVLTADHGALDIPERTQAAGSGRVDASATPEGVGEVIAERLGLHGEIFEGDWYVTTEVPEARRNEVVTLAKQLLDAHSQVAEVYTSAQVAAHPVPTGRPETWSVLDRFRASYDPQRSGDLLVALNEGLSTIPAGSSGSVAGHGTVWDYDRKVPILFWWPNALPQDRPESAMTVDILPTLASLIGVPVPAGEIDGKCLDLQAGEGSNCQ